MTGVRDRRFAMLIQSLSSIASISRGRKEGKAEVDVAAGGGDAVMPRWQTEGLVEEQTRSATSGVMGRKAAIAGKKVMIRAALTGITGMPTDMID